jgi:hypothetical protein
MATDGGEIAATPPATSAARIISRRVMIAIALPLPETFQQENSNSL